MTFQLHPQLQQDSILCGRLDLCQIRLINDKQYPWFILIPEINDISEIFQLKPEQQSQLLTESSLLAEKLSTIYQADKMNIASIGNIVPQLHIHHIVRYQTDKAWPGPVWGKFPAVAYSQDEINQRLHSISDIFA